MEFDEICRFFGGTIFTEDFRGDFAQLQADIEKLAHEEGAESPQAIALVNLLRGILAILRGNYAFSQACFDRIHSLEQQLSKKWVKQIKYYERVLLVSKIMPPLLRTYAAITGTVVRLRECELGTKSILTTPPIAYKDPSLIRQAERATVQTLNSCYTACCIAACGDLRYANEGVKNTCKSLRDNFKDFPSSQDLQCVESAGPQAVHVYLLRLRCQISSRYTDDAIEDTYQDVFKFCLEFDDRLGMAVYYIELADRLLSPPFTSPILLNLVLDYGTKGWEHQDWDKAEPSFRLRRNDEADACYGMALSYVKDISAPRVEGAVYLRRACVTYIEGIHLMCHNDQRNADDMFLRASMYLSWAEKHFRMDDAHMQIVACRRILLQICRDDQTELRQQATEMGAWGYTNENTALSQALGLLLMRVGRRLFLDYSRVDLAASCIDCAIACFRALNDEVSLFQARLAQAQLHHVSGNFVSAQLTVDDIRQTTKVFQSLQDLDTRSGEDLNMIILNLLTASDTIVSSIYGSAGDARQLANWRQEYDDLKCNLNLTETLREHAEDLPFNDDSGKALKIEEMVSENDADSRLAVRYNSYLAEAHGFLERADVSGYENRILAFLDESDSLHRQSVVKTGYEIIANAALNRFDQAQKLLPRAVSTTFHGSARNLIDSELKASRSQNIEVGANKEFVIDWKVNFERQIDLNAAIRALHWCHLAHDWNTGYNVLQQSQRIFPSIFNEHDRVLDRTDWILGVAVACIFEYNNQAEKAFSWYEWSLSSLYTQRSHVADPEARRGLGWSIHHSALYSGLTRLAIMFAMRSTSHDTAIHNEAEQMSMKYLDWSCQALVFMEDSFARTLLEMMIACSDTSIDVLEAFSHQYFISRRLEESALRRKLRLEEIDKLEIEFEAAKQQGRMKRKDLNFYQDNIAIAKQPLSNIEKKIEQDKARLAELENELKTVHPMEATKALLGATSFRVDIPALVRCIPINTLVVELATSREGFIILGVTSSGIQVMHQDQINEIDLRRLLFPCIKDLRAGGKEWQSPTINAKLETISKIVLDPLKKFLGQAEHIVFVPSSIFLAFPMLCLMYDGRPLICTKAVSQVPSLATLERLIANRKKETEPPRKVSGFAVVNSHQDTSESVPSVAFSALVLHRSFDIPVMPAQEVTDDRFAAEYRRADIVHIGTHGDQEPSLPWQAYMSLRGKFQVMELARLRTNASLVFFCACLSGLGKATNGNDVLGFSHAVLQSGAQVYMGALWKVSEVETLLLMNLFYRKLGIRGQGLTIAKAWQHAQTALRSMSKEQALAMMEESMEDWKFAQKKGLQPEVLSNDGLRWLDNKVDDIRRWDENHLQNPYYWASFLLMGNADLCLC